MLYICGESGKFIRQWPMDFDHAATATAATAAAAAGGRNIQRTAWQDDPARRHAGFGHSDG
jgi:hypothetical protein